MAAGVVWAGLAAGFLVLLLTAVVFRVQVVQLWPRTAGAYATVKLTVNPVGLVPDEVQAAQALQDGQLALVVTGVERNVEARPRAPADLRVSLYDKAGRRLAGQVVRPGGASIAAGDSRAFRTSFLDPPPAGAQIGVDFVFATPSSGEAHGEAAAPKLRARASALPLVPMAVPVSAKALPIGSPYALPGAARSQGVAVPNG